MSSNPLWELKKKLIEYKVELWEVVMERVKKKKIEKFIRKLEIGFGFQVLSIIMARGGYPFRPHSIHPYQS